MERLAREWRWMAMAPRGFADVEIRQIIRLLFDVPVKTKSIIRAPARANSCQILQRSPWVGRCSLSSTSRASGCTAPLGKLPALWPSNRPSANA